MSILFPNMIILNVDDDEISCYTKSRILRRAGFEVIEAATGTQALQSIRQDKPPLVLLDVGLPDINGLEVCRMIKNDPAMALTLVLQVSASLITSSDKARGLEGGADAYLSEPVEPEELVATVKALLRLRQAEAALETQRAFLRQVIDLNPSFIFAKDREGRFALVNQAVADAYGTTVENLVGKTDADFASNPAEVDHFQRDDLEVMDSRQEKFISEETITDARGQVRWLQTVKRPIIGEDGQVNQILGVATDITLRKQTQAALTQLNETLEQRVHDRTALIQLLQDIAAAANEAEAVEEALRFALDRVCAYTGWPVGHVYWLDREKPSELVSSSIWHLDEPGRFERFRHLSEAIRFTRGVGLPGQVLASGELTWIDDVTINPDSPRSEAAAHDGLKAAFGFPLWVGQEIVAVLEFFSKDSVKPDGPFLEAVNQIGTQLGRVVERRRADRRIRESEQQLLEAQQIAHLGSWQWDIINNEVNWSDELYRIYGLLPQGVEITYEGFLERVHPDDRERVTGLIGAAYQSGQPFDYEHRIIRPDGIIRTLHAQGKVILGEKGQPLKMVGTGHDITQRKEMEEQLRRLNAELEQRVVERTAQLATANRELADEIDERKQIEEALRESEARFRMMADTAPVLVWMSDPDKQSTYFNKSWLDFTGRALEQEWSFGWAEGVHPDDYERVLDIYNIAFDDRQPFEMEYRLRRSDGQYRWIVDQGIPRFEGEQFVGYIGSCIDIHERKRAELAERILAEAGDALTHPFDPIAQLSKLAWLAVPNLADWCAVDIFEEDWTVHHVAVAHVDPAKVELANEVRRRYPPSQEELAQGSHPWQQGKSELYPEITEDLLKTGARDEEHFRILQDLQLRSAMVVPLIGRERIFGLMAFFWAESGNHYDTQDLALAEELARRAAIALDNARAYEIEQQARQEAEAASERLSLLAEASQVLISSSDYKTALSNLAHVTTLSLADWCVVDVLEADGLLHRLAVVHQDPAKADLAAALQQNYPVVDPQGDHTIARVLRQGSPWFDAVVSSIRLETEARDPEHFRLIQGLGVASEIVAPLMAHGHNLGALTLVRMNEAQPFDTDDLKLAQELARRVAIVIDNARLYEAEQQARQNAEAAVRRITSLQEVTAALSEALTPSQVTQAVITPGLSLLGADGGTITMPNETGDYPRVVDYFGYSVELIEAYQATPLSPDEGVISEAICTGQAVFVETFQAALDRYPIIRGRKTSNHQAWAALPLKVQDQTIGAISLSFAEPHTFSNEERAFLQALTQQCAQALERARLYETEQKARVEAEASQQRLALLAEARERNRLAQELHDTVAQALGYLNLKIGGVAARLANGEIEAVEADLHEAKQVINEAYTDVREEIFNLRAKVMSGLGFMEMLDRYIDKYRSFYNLNIQLIQEDDPALFELPASVTPQIVRTIQEALINIRKHAQVDTAIINLGQESGNIRISIEDYGQGFDPLKIKEKTSSFGLQIMRERVESIGGNLEIDTALGRGTRIILRFPIS